MATTIPPGFDKALALKLANASMLAYNQLNYACPVHDARRATRSWGSSPPTCSGTWSRSDYLMKSATDAVLAFRGTDDFPDAIADIRFNQASYPLRSECRHDPYRLYERVSVMSRRGDRRRECAARGHHALHHRPQPGRRRRDPGRARRGRQYAIYRSRSSTPSPARASAIPNFANRFDSALVTGPTFAVWRIVNMFDLVPLLPPRDIFDPFDDTTYFYQHVTNFVLSRSSKAGRSPITTGKLHRGDRADALIAVKLRLNVARKALLVRNGLLPDHQPVPVR